MKQKTFLNFVDTKFLQRVINISFLLTLVIFLTSFLKKESEPEIVKSEGTATVGFDPYIGEIAIYPYNFAPAGWAKCDGQLLPIASNTALFSLIGTIYGGDGVSTFALPDLRGRVIINNGQGPGLPNYPVGSKSGSVNTILSVANLPAHNHTGTIRAKVGAGDESNPTGGYLATSSGDLYAEDQNTTMAADAVLIGNTGSGTSFTNMPPYLTVGYYIALQGIYPSQN